MKSLPVDKLNIDRTVIATDPASKAIVTAIVSLAKSLDREVLGEGVETEARRRALLVCDYRHTRAREAAAARRPHRPRAGEYKRRHPAGDVSLLRPEGLSSLPTDAPRIALRCVARRNPLHHRHPALAPPRRGV